MQPGSYTVPGDIGATVVRILAYMGALAILAIAAASFFRPPSGSAAAEPAAHPLMGSLSSGRIPPSS